ncbi:MAG: LysR family transcriptional regulator [Solimonas sp.]
MDIRQLRYFVVVAEEKNFSRAAGRLHVSQPPLSTQVKALEEELGVHLFRRSNRGVALTAAGQVFYDEVRLVLRRLEQACLKAQSAGRGDVGLLAIGFVSIVDYGVLPPALKRFRAQFPGVEVELHEFTTDAQIKEIRAGRLDLGIGIGPVDEPDLAFEAIWHEKLVLAAPAGHPLARGDGPVPLAAFASERFIITPRDVASGLHDLIVETCRAHGFAPRITQRARQMQTIISLVASGMGFAIVPESVRHLKRGGVQYRSLRGVGARIELGILRPRNDANPPAERFVAVLKDAAT